MSTVKKLTKIFSREKSLLYFCVWNESDRKAVELIGHHIENNLFIVPPTGQKGTVWYEEEELEFLKNIFRDILAGKVDESVWREILGTSISGWKYLEPFVAGGKKIDSDVIFKEYYNSLVDFWVVLNSILYEVVEDPHVNKIIVKQIDEFRLKTEQFTEKLSNNMDEYLLRRFNNNPTTYYLSSREVFDLFDGKLDVSWFDENRDRLIDGCYMLNQSVGPMKNLNTILLEKNLELAIQNESSLNEIIGAIAYGGDVRGRVAIVKSFNELEKVREGDIIVTEQTNPKYLTAIKKAAAIITDEGGTLCHAAIIARELKKPCIIGTKIATQVLKDGDMVEVDASKGIVRILK